MHYHLLVTLGGKIKFVSAWLLVVVLATFAGNVSLLAANNDGVASNALVHKAGLVVDWYSQSEIAGGGQIVDWELTVDTTKSTTFFVIEAGHTREVISEHDVDAFGNEFGLDGAVAHIETRKEVLAAELKFVGDDEAEIKTDQYVLPDSTLYVLSSNGTLSAINADTGKTKWTTLFGDLSLPNIGLGAGNRFVAAVNGSSVYCFQAETGKVLWSRPCKYGVAAAPAVSEDHIYVPLLDNRIEIFPINVKRGGLDSFTLIANGYATARPLVTPITVSWPTTNGYLNVAASSGMRQHSIAFRLDADGTIDSTPTFRDGILYSASLDGFVYALEENGGLRWQVSLGARISQAPIVMGDSVYIITNRNRLFRLNKDSGSLEWQEPLLDVKGFLAGNRERLYFLDTINRIMVIDRISGAVLSKVDVGDVRMAFANQISDRIYIASETGVVQCLHEITKDVPSFPGDESFGEKNAGKSKPRASEPEDSPSSDEPIENPFGGIGELDDNSEGSSDSANPIKPQVSDDNPLATPANTDETDRSDDDPFK